jgi:OOP family OmpA-OmpF porin
MYRSRALALAVVLAIGATGCANGGFCICNLLTADVAEGPPAPEPEPQVAFTPPVEVPQVAAPPPARVIVLRGVNFGFDSDVIRDEDRAILDAAIETLGENPEVRVTIVGHTDNIGPKDYNQGLSERRAETVLRYLTQGGVAASQLDSEGEGKANPVADNATRDGRAQNRRVELNISE